MDKRHYIKGTSIAAVFVVRLAGSGSMAAAADTDHTMTPMER